MSQLPKAEFAFPGPLRDELVAAILRGEKTSTTSLVIDYEDEPLPAAGELSELVDSADHPLAVIETDSVRTSRLGDVDLQHAVDEGEGYDSVAHWLVGHTRFWLSYRPDLVIDDDLMLVLECFHVVRRVFDRAVVNAAFAAEAAALSAALKRSDGADLPTRCPPWTVKDEFAHTAVAIQQTLVMLDEPAPAGELVPAAGYYKPEKRFAPEANAARVGSAQNLASQRTMPELAAWFDEVWPAVVERAVAESLDRMVTTRWGDPMLLTEFQVTRVVELAVHGLDLADALSVTPWLTTEASDVVEALILPAGAAVVRERLGWDRAQALRKLTGRAELTTAERSTLDASSTTWLTLG